MKIIGGVDFLIQSLALALLTVISIILLFTGEFETMAIAAMFAALFIGPWQLLSSITTVIAKQPFLQWRKIHMTCSLIYIAIGSLTLSFYSDEVFGDFVGAILMGLAFGIPTILAGFYWYITFRTNLLK